MMHRRGLGTELVSDFWLAFAGETQLEADERIKLLELDGVANAKLVIEDLQYQDKGQ